MDVRYDRLAGELRELGLEIQYNVPMESLTSFRIGGPADLLVTAAGPRDISAVQSVCRKHDVPLTFMGNGTNMLVSDKGVDGVVLRLTRDGSPVVEDGLVICPAGLSLKKLCMFSRDLGLSGLEFAYGIPGSVGGAVYMNAGAYCGQISDVLSWAEACFADGQIRRIEAKGLRFGYRHSVFMENGAFVTWAAFCLVPDSPSAINARMEDFLKRRIDKQPLEYPSAGSFFKRPEGNYAGALIEKSGLKGFCVGAAQVSQKHAGFIINLGGATFSDVCGLARIVTERVLRDSGVKLQPEVCYIGRV